MDSGDTENLTEYIAAIRQEIMRVESLTEDIMLYTKEHIELRYSRFSLKELLENITQQYSLSLKYMNMSVNLKTSGEFFITADKNRLFRVIFNLVHNAVQALVEGGKVVLHLKYLKMRNMAHLAIFDNGKGIPKENLNSIFDPFVTSGKAYGTGLGLLVVREIINAHNGVIRVRSTPNRYTVFTIILPVAHDGVH
jgi:signal transduction histidine kinase